MSDETLQIQASVLHGPGNIKIETRSISPPGPSEVQVAVRCTGLCGSDVHYFKHFRNGDILVREPLTLGHESSGVVVAVGEGVDGELQVGDQVALEVGIPCSQCELCKAGRYNICPLMDFRSSAKRYPHAQGTLQERINHPVRYCHKIPNGLSFAEGALAEPVSVAIHAMRRSSIAPGHNILVFGAGPIGLFVSAIAKIRKSGIVVIADIDGDRLKFATENGMADFSYKASGIPSKHIDEQLKLAKEMPEKFKNCLLPYKYDIVFECTGSPACLQAAIFVGPKCTRSSVARPNYDKLTKPGGKVVMIGMGNPVQTLPISAAALREVDLLGVFRYAGEYKEALKTIAEHSFLMKIVTRRFRGFSEINHAFEVASKSNDESGKMTLKVLIDFD